MEQFTSFLFLIALFGFQIVRAQNQNLSPEAKKMISFIADIKKEFASGDLHKDNWESGYYLGDWGDVMQPIQAAFSKSERLMYFEYEHINDKDKPVVEAALDDLAKEAKRYGIKYGFSMAPQVAAILEELPLLTKSIEQFNGVNNFPDDKYNHIPLAVSANARATWAKTFFDAATTQDEKSQVYAELDKLAGVCKRKIPLLIPKDGNWQFHNATEESLMKSQIKGIERMKIHKIGLSQDNWLMATEIASDYPLFKYKDGFIWLKDPNADHPFCSLYHVQVRQDHVGYGKYGASYARIVGEKIFGNPK